MTAVVAWESCPLELAKQGGATNIGNLHNGFRFSSKKIPRGLADAPVGFIGVEIVKEKIAAVRQTRIEKREARHGHVIFVGIKQDETEGFVLQTAGCVGEKAYAKFDVIQVFQAFLDDLHAGIAEAIVCIVPESVECIEKVEFSFRHLFVQKAADVPAINA